ncbi:MAG: triose-phosphate isomerase [Rhizobiales bacterium 65-9]|nr:triose-phosphate isomerase [Hyphomicrobiales bacterium]OJY35391.1 MAG: triose-phosphate isomerase [Rhizobiales bacterium 65-9]
MSVTRRPLVAGNWKMNGSKLALGELVKMAAGLVEDGLWRKVDLALCPPAPFLYLASAAAIGTRIAIGAQDCHAEPSGAFTGDISAEMIAESGCSYVIVGHSERRSLHGETDDIVRAKAQAAVRAGLAPIVCVGETREERDGGRTLDVIGRQLAGSIPNGAAGLGMVIAYEPVWAIGTGLTPTAADVKAAHGFLRDQLRKRFGAAAEGVRLLYGGSVKPANAAELLSVDDVDGALVGGASLKAEDFLGIAAAYRTAPASTYH